jgi:hypothetical protein
MVKMLQHFENQYIRVCIINYGLEFGIQVSAAKNVLNPYVHAERHFKLQSTPIRRVGAFRAQCVAEPAARLLCFSNSHGKIMCVQARCD